MATKILSPDTIFTTSEAAAYMGFQEDTVRQYINREVMEAKKAGPIYLVKKSECDRYLRERRPVGNPGKQAVS